MKMVKDTVGVNSSSMMVLSTKVNGKKITYQDLEGSYETIAIMKE